MINVLGSPECIGSKISFWKFHLIWFLIYNQARVRHFIPLSAITNLEIGNIKGAQTGHYKLTYMIFSWTVHMPVHVLFCTKHSSVFIYIFCSKHPSLVGHSFLPVRFHRQNTHSGLYCFHHMWRLPPPPSPFTEGTFPSTESVLLYFALLPPPPSSPLFILFSMSHWPFHHSHLWARYVTWHWC